MWNPQSGGTRPEDPGSGCRPGDAWPRAPRTRRSRPAIGN